MIKTIKTKKDLRLILSRTIRIRTKSVKELNMFNIDKYDTTLIIETDYINSKWLAKISYLSEELEKKGYKLSVDIENEVLKEIFELAWMEDLIFKK